MYLRYAYKHKKKLQLTDVTNNYTNCTNDNKGIIITI